MASADSRDKKNKLKSRRCEDINEFVALYDWFYEWLKSRRNLSVFKLQSFLESLKQQFLQIQYRVSHAIFETLSPPTECN